MVVDREFSEIAAANSGKAMFLARFAVSRETTARLERYVALLAKWRSALNLIGPTTPDAIWTRHLLDSAQLAALLHPAAAAPASTDPRPLIDLGSGAGFPGLVLAILGEPNVHLIESDQRKAVFLREAARETGAAATVHAERIENIRSILAPARVITARALAPLVALLGYAAAFSDAATMCLFPKGRTWREELTAAQALWTMRSATTPSITHSDGVILQVWDAKRKS